MTNNEIDLLIARSLGWTEYPDKDFHDRQGGILIPYYWCNPRTGKKGNIEKYHADVNAMIEAEDNITEEEYGKYNGILWELMLKAHPDKSTIWCADRVTSAPASFRAEAYIRIKNLCPTK